MCLSVHEYALRVYDTCMGVLCAHASMCKCSEHVRVRMHVCVYMRMHMYLLVQAAVPPPLPSTAPTKLSSVEEAASVGAAAPPATDEEALVKPAFPEEAASVKIGAPPAAGNEPAEEAGEATPDKVATMPDHKVATMPIRWLQHAW